VEFSTSASSTAMVSIENSNSFLDAETGLAGVHILTDHDVQLSC
jgi:hypothetical protein